MIKKKIKIYQAGYVSLTGWHFAGRGSSIDDARINLNINISEAAKKLVKDIEAMRLADGHNASTEDDIARRISLAISDSIFGLEYKERVFEYEEGDIC